MKVHIRGEDGEIIYKIIIIGDPSIGKTSLIRKFVKDQFEVDYIPTVGVNISKQPVDLTIQGKDLHINLMIWDLAGKPQFHLLHKVYYNGANAVILAFDLTRSYTFMNVKNWFSEVVKYGLSDKPIILVGNKSDLEDKRVVSEAHIEHMKEQLGNPEYLETSAKDGLNVDQLFNDIAQMIYEHHV